MDSPKSLKILALEPFYGGSHRSFLEGLKRYSAHQWTALTLKDRHWKWHMRAAPLIFQKKLPQQKFDLVFASDFLDVATFRGLSPELQQTPFVLYMHENQITYPVQESKERDRHFGMTNISSIMAADAVWWNSSWHKQDFLQGAKAFLQRMPGGPYEHWLDKAKSGPVMHLGVELPPKSSLANQGPLRILWNHRWEFDKRPDLFFEALSVLKASGLDFELSVVGERYKSYPEIFDKAREEFSSHVVQWGYCASREEYVRQLQQADLVISTADHEFFGVSMVEAVHAGCLPLVPNRLSYPEILAQTPAELRQKIFYDSPSQLVSLLKAYASDPRSVRNIGDQFGTEQYDWSNRAVCFDNAFEALL